MHCFFESRYGTDRRTNRRTAPSLNASEFGGWHKNGSEAHFTHRQIHNIKKKQIPTSPTDEKYDPVSSSSLTSAAELEVGDGKKSKRHSDCHHGVLVRVVNPCYGLGRQRAAVHTVYTASRRSP